MSQPNYQDFSFEQYPIKDIDMLRIGILYSEWNPEIVNRLVDQCRTTLTHYGIVDPVFHKVPGSYELPLGAKYMLSASSRYDAIICLGCVIRGETKHDDYINHTIARSINQISLVSGTPVIFGVLTTNTREQAIERSGGSHGDKGTESAMAALKMISLKQTLTQKGGKISF